MEFFDVIFSRHSIRSFLDEEIENEKLEALLNAINSAPSAGDLQAYEIVVVRDSKQKDALTRACYNQKFVGQAPIILVFCANPDRSASNYGNRGADLYCIQDATIAAAYAQLAAVNMGLATVWVGAFGEAQVSKIIGGLKPICILPLGYPGEAAETTSRRSLSEIVHKEKLAA